MSRTRVRAEDLFCARCHRPVRLGTHHWPEGYLCSGCFTRALETYGTCTGCDVERLTPGLAPDGGKLCTDCAGGLGDFTCERCGQEARRYRRGVCGRCVLAERLHELLDDSTGSIRPEFLPLFDTLRQMKRPWGGLTWTSHPHVQRNLRALARGQVPLSHEGLSLLAPWRSVAYLRDLLMQSGVLAPADRQLLLFQRWLAEKLPTVSEPEHHKLLELFAAWHIQRRLRTLAGRGPLTGKQIQQARSELHLAIAFLGHLAERGRTLADCTQADVDTWYAGGYTARRLTHAFLRWAMRSNQMPAVTVPHRSTSNPAPIAQHQRLALLRQLADHDDVPLQDRVAAVLVLLYAQPLTRIARLGTDDVQHEDGEVLIRLGDPPSPVPAPFAGMLLDYLGQRPNTMTATNPDARWLFPGHRAGQPMTPSTLELRLRHLGFPIQRGRTAAIRHLVLQAPAPVIARMLGYNDDTQPASPKRPEEPGVTTLLATTHGHHEHSTAEEYATPDYARSPVRYPSQARRRTRQRPETLGAPLATRGTDGHSAVDAGLPRFTGRAGGMPGEICECGLLGVGPPCIEAVEVHRGRGELMLQTSLGQAVISASPQTEGSNTLGDGAFDTSPVGVLLLPLLSVFLGSCLLDRLILRLRAEGDPTAHVPLAG